MATLNSAELNMKVKAAFLPGTAMAKAFKAD